MNWSLVAFAAFATIAIVGSLMVVLKKNPVASAFALVLVFFSFAGLYAIVGAHLIAALQILVYTGAIMVLFVFVIMLLNQDTPVMDLKESSGLFKGITVLGLFGLASTLINTALRAKSIAPTGDLTEEKIQEMGGNLRVVSELLFSEKLFHFELISFLILGAIVASIALSKRKNSRGVSA
jgi:NADH-quinone oxidoreductase subunit J